MKPSTPSSQVLLSWSGGKDSALALRALRADTSYEVVGLLTSVTWGYDRISIHGVRRSVLEAQVAAVGIALVEVPIPAAASNAIYEHALASALAGLRQHPALRHLALAIVSSTCATRTAAALLD
jgi:diphthamide synthase (EF-2-diphthine--ammonia ligase)